MRSTDETPQCVIDTSQSKLSVYQYSYSILCITFIDAILTLSHSALHVMDTGAMVLLPECQGIPPNALKLPMQKNNAKQIRDPIL